MTACNIMAVGGSRLYAIKNQFLSPSQIGAKVWVSR